MPNYSASCRTRSFITASTTAGHLSLLSVTLFHYTLSYLSFKTHFNIIFPHTSNLSKLSPSFKLSNENLYAFLVIVVCAICPANPFLLDLITLIILSEKYKSRRYSLWNSLWYPVTSSLSGPTAFCNNSLSNTFSLWPFLTCEKPGHTL